MMDKNAFIRLLLSCPKDKPPICPKELGNFVFWEKPPIWSPLAGTNGRYYQFMEDWWYYTSRLGKWVCIPAGFIFDQESIPLYRGENPIAGGIHDFHSRFDSVPMVSKIKAALLYEDAQSYEDSLYVHKEKTFIEKVKKVFNDIADWVGREVKRDAVIAVPDDVYWHKFSVKATYEEITA